ncbi:hypothetical protein GCK32_021259 [Trichostrongylus colubriformis]|uniref:Uncharacterized protein n=1 Tax=Trichostrongylus colubriformis TaxID=6319 RepID=A0AAN8IVR7_TRICO
MNCIVVPCAATKSSLWWRRWRRIVCCSSGWIMLRMLPRELL